MPPTCPSMVAPGRWYGLHCCLVRFLGTVHPLVLRQMWLSISTTPLLGSPQSTTGADARTALFHDSREPSGSDHRTGDVPSRTNR